MKNLIGLMILIASIQVHAGGVFEVKVEGAIGESPAQTLEKASRICQLDNAGVLHGEILLSPRMVKAPRGHTEQVYDVELGCGAH